MENISNVCFVNNNCGVIVPYKFNGKIRACNVDVIIKEAVATL